MLTATYYPTIGGAETVIQHLTANLNSRGIKADVVTFNKVWNSKWRGKTELSDNGVKIFRIPGLEWCPAHSNRITMGVNVIPGRFTNLLENYDILHFHGELSFPFFSYFIKKPKIFHFHGLNFAFYQRYFLGRLILKNVADLYISLTNRMKKDLIKLGLPESRITCLPNGVDIDLFNPSGEKDENLLLFVGRIEFGKGLHVLLNSLAYLKRPIRLVIIGPPGWDYKYFMDVLELVRRENAKNKHHIDYLGAKVQADVVQWYQRASILVMPSVAYEALGVVNLEALACATPVVATDIGGISDIVRDGKNGLLVKPNDAVGLADAIQCLLDNKEMRENFGQQGRRWVVENFSNDVIVQRLTRIYEKLLE